VDKLIALGFLIIATTLEANGDAIVRMGLGQHAIGPRVLLFLAGAGLLFGYGLMLNLAPLEFGRVVGLYIATLFVVWQMVNFVTFRSLPTIPILVGGAFIVAGGMIVSFWNP
jgi:small multidrug resistance family-3 protein